MMRVQSISFTYHRPGSNQAGNYLQEASILRNSFPQLLKCNTG